MKSISNFIRSCFLGLFFFTPIIFTYFNSELFELPKMYFVYSLTLIILSLHLINYIRGQAPLFKRTFLDIPLLIFLISQTISTIISVDPHTSIFGYYSRLNGGLLSVVNYLLLYWILSVYIDDKFKNRSINLFLFSGFLVALFGIAEHFGIDKNTWVQDVQSRVFSTLGQPNWLAAYICILLPFSVYKFLEVFPQKKFFTSTYYFLLSASFYLCLLFTKSKSGLIAAAASLIIFFVLFTFKSLKNKSLKINLKPAFFVLTTIFLFSILINNPIKDRLFPQKQVNPNPVDTVALNITPSEDIRKIVWKGTLDLWKKFPVFGTGTETFAYTYYWTRPLEHNLTSEWDFLYNKAHNEYLNYLATTGFVGLISYLLIIVFVIFRLTRNIFKSKDNYLLSLSILSAYFSILITNIAGFSVVTVSVFFFLLPSLLNTNSLEIKNKPGLFKKTFSIAIIILCAFLFQKNIFYYLGDITYNQSQTADGKENYELAYKLISSSLIYRPDEPVYLTQASLISSKMALISAAQKDTIKTQNYIDTAIKYSNNAVSISPANTNIWKERAQMYYYLSSVDTKYFQESINSLTKVTILAPTDAKTYYLIGQFLDSAKLIDEAAVYYQKAIDTKPNYDHAYFALGLIQFEQKKYSDAKTSFESTVKYAPTNSDAKNYIDQIDKLAKPKK